MSEKTYDVVAQRLDNGSTRLLDENLTEENAEAVVRFAVIRRGVEEEFYYTVPHGEREEANP